MAVKRVLLVQEMGLVINPAGARIQIEGGITQSLGYALSEEIHFKDGAIQDLNFDRYRLPHFSELPRIETVILDAPDLSAKGGGTRRDAKGAFPEGDGDGSTFASKQDIETPWFMVAESPGIDFRQRTD